MLIVCLFVCLFVSNSETNDVIKLGIITFSKPNNKGKIMKDFNNASYFEMLLHPTLKCCCLFEAPW